ncbi:MAG: hypothetical protein IJP62_05890 [Treponema sp.]|nr:hypothetical protein [Treponema sp.]
MGRNERRRGRNNNWNSNQKKNISQKENNTQKSREQRHDSKHTPLNSQLQQQMRKEIAENESAIREFKSRNPVCELCGQPILEMASAMANKGSGNPVHFDCIVKKLSEHERLSEKDRMTYIGNGKFAVLHFENPHDMRHFSIVKEIEWERAESERSAWREEMAGLYSQIK